MSTRNEGAGMTRESKDRQNMRDKLEKLQEEGNTISKKMRETQMELCGVNSKIELLESLLGDNDDE